MTEIIVLPASQISRDLADINEKLTALQKTVDALLNAPKASPWMTAKEVCQYRRFGQTTLRAKVRAGLITRHDTPDGVRYRREEVENLKIGK